MSREKPKDALRFISTADWHWRLSNPRSRLDCFPESVTAKILEIFDLARTIKADGILLAGDLMDSEWLSWSAVKELGKVLLKSPCPIYAIGGQHEENGHDPGSLDRFAWGTMAAWEIIHNVAEIGVWFEFADRKTVTITGKHYGPDAETEDYYFAREGRPKSDYYIHLAHGTVVDRPAIFKHTVAKEIKTSADYVCVGDYHPGLENGFVEIESTFGRPAYVVSPGALSRMAGSVTEMERRIRVAVITVDKDGIHEPEMVTIRSARPGSEVLTREHIEAMTEAEKRELEFFGLLEQEKRRNFNDSIEILNGIAKMDKIRVDVRDDAEKRILKAREELGQRERVV